MIPWSTALRELRNDRPRRADVREERLRATTGLDRTIPLSSWRGRSGRRYVVGVHPLSERAVQDVTEAVILAVRRDGEGVAQLVDVASAGASPRERLRRSWTREAAERGATELHVHRLAKGDEERSAIVDDLRGEADGGARAPQTVARE
jgi:hypothetical protein